MRKKIIATIFTTLLIFSLVPWSEVAAENYSKDIIKYSKEQIGVPYRWGGTTPNGFDCSGFIRYVYNKIGIELPRTASEQYNSGVAVSKKDLQVGDLVFFETYKPGPSHSGIYIGNGDFVHASSSKGITISSVNDPYYWAPKYLGAKRILEDEHKVEQKVVISSLPAGQYNDVNEDFWAYDAIKALGEEGIITGYDNSFYRPNENVTRAQVAIILSRILDLKPAHESKTFKDLNNNHYAHNEIQAVVEAKLFSEDLNGNIRPNDLITREEISLIFSKAFELPEASNITQFNDIDPSHPSFDAVQRLAASGITSGYEDDTFRLGNNTTRAELALFIHRAIYE